MFLVSLYSGSPQLFMIVFIYVSCIELRFFLLFLWYHDLCSASLLFISDFCFHLFQSILLIFKLSVQFFRSNLVVLNNSMFNTLTNYLLFIIKFLTLIDHFLMCCVALYYVSTFASTFPSHSGLHTFSVQSYCIVYSCLIYVV